MRKIGRRQYKLVQTRRKKFVPPKPGELKRYRGPSRENRK